MFGAAVGLVAIVFAVISIVGALNSHGSSISVSTAIPSSLRQDSSSATGNVDQSVIQTGFAMIDIVGEVQHPGLVTVATGARVIDAVMRAGGLTPHADQCGINLARTVTDGEQIIVPRKSKDGSLCTVASRSGDETASSGVSASVGVGEKISLSRANATQLEALPGVGPALAQRIIDYRTAHGGFSQVAQLDNVSGIGPSLMAQISPLVQP